MFFACNKGEERESYSLTKHLLKYEGNSIIEYDNGNVKVFDKLSDTFPCGTYFFNKDLQLEFYVFLTSTHLYNYRENFDSLGHLVSMEGHPLVMQFYKQKLNDSIEFTTLYFALNKLYSTVYTTTNLGDSFSVNMYKADKFSNTLYTKFYIPTKNINDVETYNHYEFFDSSNRKRYVFVDTIRYSGIE